MNIETGWNPTLAEYHDLAREGVVSSSMLLDLVPPLGRPRIYRDYYITGARKKRLVGVDAWRGSIVDAVLTEGAHIGKCGPMGSLYGVWRDDSLTPEAVIPPKFNLTKNKDKEAWANWKRAAAREGMDLIGLSTDKHGKETRDLAKAQKLLDEVSVINDFILSGATPAAELARELLQGDSGVSQFSHRFTWNGIDCRWRPDRLLEGHQYFFEGLPGDIAGLVADYAHVSLKVTKDAHPGPFWANYQKAGWGMRDAFYELGWAHLTMSPFNFEFPWSSPREEAENPYIYHGDEPIDWIVIVAHHLPTPEVYVHIVPEAQRRLGRKRCTEALQLLKSCYDTNDWSLPEERAAQLGRDPAGWEWSS